MIDKKQINVYFYIYRNEQMMFACFKKEKPLFDFMTIVRALADDNRIRILMALRGRELCVCQITGLLDLAPSTTSRHLSILRQARLIESRKKGKWVYYYLPDSKSGQGDTANGSGASVLAGMAVEWIERSLNSDSVILGDAERIEQILATEKECYGVNEEEADAFHSPEIHSLAETILDKE